SNVKTPGRLQRSPRIIGQLQRRVAARGPHAEFRVGAASQILTGPCLLVHRGAKIVGMITGAFRSPRNLFAYDNAVAAAGTEAGDHDLVPGPTNRVRIWCFKARGMCEENMAWLTLDDWNGVSLFLLDVLEYQITSWSSSRVTAERQAPCFTAQ